MQALTGLASGTPPSSPLSGALPGEKVRGRLKTQGLGRDQRLRQSALFRETYEQGRRYTGRLMVLWLRRGEGANLRLGVVSSRKVGNAVQRARARRLLREAFRRYRCRLAGSCDVVLVARRNILEARWSAVVGELLDLAEQARLLQGGPAG